MNIISADNNAIHAIAHETLRRVRVGTAAADSNVINADGAMRCHSVFPTLLAQSRHSNRSGAYAGVLRPGTISLFGQVDAGGTERYPSNIMMGRAFYNTTEPYNPAISVNTKELTTLLLSHIGGDETAVAGFGFDTETHNKTDKNLSSDAVGLFCSLQHIALAFRSSSIPCVNHIDTIYSGGGNRAIVTQTTAISINHTAAAADGEWPPRLKISNVLKVTYTESFFGLLHGMSLEALPGGGGRYSGGVGLCVPIRVRWVAEDSQTPPVSPPPPRFMWQPMLQCHRDFGRGGSGSCEQDRTGGSIINTLTWRVFEDTVHVTMSAAWNSFKSSTIGVGFEIHVW